MSVISNDDNTYAILENAVDNNTHLLRRVSETSWIVKLRIQYGSIVKVPTTHLFDEETARRTHATHIYGVPHTITSDDPEHGRTWKVEWALSQFQLVYPPFLEIDHHEDDLLLVKLPHQDGPDGEYDLEPFFRKEDGIWKVFSYQVTCEFCGEVCDRINFSEKLTESIDRVSEAMMPNNKKRKYVYRCFVRRKWGYLDEGERKQICDCVLQLVRRFFPVPAGDEPMGFREV